MWYYNIIIQLGTWLIALKSYEFRSDVLGAI